MSTSAAGERLASLTKELLSRWQRTRGYWRDDKAREFEERFMLELESDVKAAVTGLADIERVISKVRNDCE